MEESVNKYWPLFWAICIAAWVIHAAISLSWSGSAGSVFVPSLVGFFLVRSSSTPTGARASYGAFFILLIVIIGVELNSARRAAVDEIMAGCVTRNPTVAALPTDEKKNSFCSCISKDMSWTVMLELGVSFLLFQEPKAINDNPNMQARGNIGLEPVRHTVYFIAGLRASAFL